MRAQKKAEKILAKKRDYTYLDLEKLELGNEGVCFYAVVLEATYPHKTKKSENFVVSLKVADQTSKVDSHGVVDYVSVVFFAKKFDDLPVSQRCGEIIRVHRGNVNTFQGRKQVTVNMLYNSSWALFHPQYYGKNDKFDEF